MKITRTIALKDFAPYARSFRDEDHWLPAMTDEVLAQVVRVVDTYIEQRETYEDTCSAILVELPYGVFSEWSDSSGHG